MRRRPWPIVILAIMQILSPALSIVLSAWKLHMAPQQLLWQLLKHGSTLQLFDLFGTGVIAAFAIFSVKRWSYPVFLAIFSWDVVNNFIVGTQYSQVYSTLTVVLVNAVNIVLVSYFLLPAVRAAYFNPRLRWWESKPRFRIDIPGALKFETESEPGSRFQSVHVTDISEGGVFILAESKLMLGQKVSLTFALHHVKVAPIGKVVHQGRGGALGYGIQFTEMEVVEHRALKRAIQGLRMLGYEERTPAEPWLQDLRKWLSNLLRTGKGLVPDVPKQQLKPSLKAVEELPKPVENGHDDVSKAA
jgi:hypothetical protein